MGINVNKTPLLVNWYTVLYSVYCNLKTVSVLGREEGYTVKYTPFPEGVPEVTPEGERVYLTVYPESSPNMDSISF